MLVTRFATRLTRVCTLLAALFCLGSAAHAQPCGTQWLSGDGALGFYGIARDAVVWDPDGQGPRPDLLVVGGRISSRGLDDENLLVYDGEDVYPLLGSFNGEVRALGIIDGQLVAAGAFTDAGGIPSNRMSKWTGQAWFPYGSGMNGPINAFCMHDGRLFAAGEFTAASGQPANRIAVWNGNFWSSVGSGFDGNVLALASFNGSLYAAGEFTASGQTPTLRVARWDGTNWRFLGAGLNNTALSMTVHQGRLVIGGEFTAAGGVSRPGLVAWTGSVFEAVGGSLPTTGFVRDLLSIGDTLHVANPASGGVATLTGTTWTTYPTIFGASAGFGVNAVAVYRGQLAVLGSSSGTFVKGAAIWSGTSWKPIGSGFDERINGMVRLGDEIVAVGDFTRAGTTEANSAAAWNGRVWRALSAGPGERLLAVATDGSQLYAIRVTSSPFTTDVVRYNGSAWVRQGGVLTGGQAFALAVYQGRPVVAGSFTLVGGLPRNRIATWNGSEWVDMAGGVNGPVNALTVFGDELVVGGQFTSPAVNVARWNGVSWSAYSNSLDSEAESEQVLDLHVHEGTLYAAGNFRRAGFFFPPLLNGVARLNNGSWQPVGQGLESCDGLGSFDGELLAFGGFNPTIPVRLRNFAQFDGTLWQPFAPEPDGSFPSLSGTRAMIEYNGQLLLGGSLTQTTLRFLSHMFARWSPSAVPVIATDPEPAQQIRQSGEHVVLSASITPGFAENPSNPLTFQWFRNGLPVNNGPRGASGPDAPGGVVVDASGTLVIRRRMLLTIADAQPADSGTYTVVVSNQCGSSTSIPAIVEVLPELGPCDYDYNQDENVDLLDAQQMAQVFVGLLTPESNWLDGDLNGDENADLTDAQILAAYVVTGNCGV